MEFTPETQRRATRVGAVMLALMAAGLLAMLAAAGIQWQSTRSWSVFGTFQEGVRGIRPGSAVRVGGVVMGRVTDVQFDARVRARPGDAREDGNAAVGRLLVSFDLDTDIDLRTGARIVHDVNPISGIGELDIVNVGTSQGAALPGRVGRSAMLAPMQPEGRPFSLSLRRPAIVTILGAENAGQWERISETIDAINAMFLASTAMADPDSGEVWGPNSPGAATALVHALHDLRDAVSSDLEPWRGRIDSIRGRFDLMRERLTAEAIAHDDQPSLISQLRELEAGFGPEHGLRGMGRELQPLFESAFGHRERLRQRLDAAWGRARLIAKIVGGLWPEILDDLRVSRAGFVIGASELWLATGPEFWTTLVRLFQPMSAREMEALHLIFSANRVALSATALRSAIETARALDEAGGAAGRAVSPQVREQLMRGVADALRRYRRDLSDLMNALERVADAQ